MLEIKELSKTYKNGIKALDNVTLSIGKGMFGLLGPNGAGKSSLMRTIATLQTADTGSIHFNDLPVFTSPEELRLQLGYLPQNFGVYPRITARDLLIHFAVLKGLKEAKARENQVDDLLKKTNLFKHRFQTVSSFSGGMKQRFGVAQALLGKPKLIIVDEPTAGLDPAERHRFHDLLSEIGENVVVILSTHIVEDVNDLCQRLAIINSGQIICSGIPSELIESIEGRIWINSVAKNAVEEYRSNHHLLSTRLLSGKVQVRLFSDACPEDGFKPVNATLEDVYFYQLDRVNRNEPCAV